MRRVLCSLSGCCCGGVGGMRRVEMIKKWVVMFGCDYVIVDYKWVFVEHVVFAGMGCKTVHCDLKFGCWVLDLFRLTSNALWCIGWRCDAMTNSIGKVCGLIIVLGGGKCVDIWLEGESLGGDDFGDNVGNDELGMVVRWVGDDLGCVVWLVGWMVDWLRALNW